MKSTINDLVKTEWDYSTELNKIHYRGVNKKELFMFFFRAC